MTVAPALRDPDRMIGPDSSKLFASLRAKPPSRLSRDEILLGDVQDSTTSTAVTGGSNCSCKSCFGERRHNRAQ